MNALGLNGSMNGWERQKKEWFIGLIELIRLIGLIGGGLAGFWKRRMILVYGRFHGGGN
jgi:hypothetical protein